MIMQNKIKSAMLLYLIGFITIVIGMVLVLIKFPDIILIVLPFVLGWTFVVYSFLIIKDVENEEKDKKINKE